MMVSNPCRPCLAGAVLAIVCGAAAASAQEKLIDGPVRSFTAPQGFQVVIARAEAPASVEPRIIAGLYTRFGQSTEGIPGLAHFSEHAFANTPSTLRDRPIPEGTRSLDSNAQARSDYVSAWLTVNRPDDSDASGLALAARFSSKLWSLEADDAVIDEQRARILDELDRTAPHGEYMAIYALEHAFYGARPPIAEERALAEAMTGDTIRAYQDQVYRPENVSLVVAGDLDPAAMEEALLALFAERGPIEPAPPASSTTLLRADALAPYGGPVMRRFDGVEGDWVAAGYLLPPPDSTDLAALLVLDQLMLGGRGAFETLWQIERDRDAPLGHALAGRLPLRSIGDARGYGAAIPPLAESAPAYLTVLFSAPQIDFETAPAMLHAALEEVRETALDEEAVAQARTELLDFYRRWLNTANLRPLSDHLAGLSFQETAAPLRLMDLHEEIAAVSAADVRRVMDRYLIEAAPRFGMVDGTTPIAEP